MNGTEKDKEIKVKTQKLTSALYLVSDFLSDENPLKRRLRDKALDCLVQTTDGNFFVAANSIGQLLALIEVALSTPGVSQMNFGLLRGEYEKLKDKMLGVNEESLSLDSPAALPEKAPAPVPPAKNEPPKEPKPKAVNNSRKEQILSFIKSHSWSSIKDISRILPNVSTKTVQRELAEMVQNGVLKREGDRRWSRYELAS